MNPRFPRTLAGERLARLLHNPRMALLRVVLLGAFVSAAGCATQVQVVSDYPSRSRPHVASSSGTRSWWNVPSFATVLRRHGLESLMQTNPDLALQSLHQAAYTSTNLHEIADAVDLTLRYAQRFESRQPRAAAGWQIAAARLAYQPMLHRDQLSSTNPWDSRLVQLYNRATAGAVTALQELTGSLRASQVISAGSVAFQVSAEAGDEESGPDYFDHWLIADQWRQKGLPHRYRDDGLGARLIAVRTNRQATALEKHLPDEGIFRPATAILQFERIEEVPAGRPHPAKLVLYNPRLTPRIEVGSERWPLAADHTLPGAMLLSRTRPLFKTRWTALMRPGKTSRPNRLYLFEPYSPDRIPIIMVHGLHSTPLAWQQLTNELLGDPEIRARFQIWHYLYPTGLPFLTSAADLRDELERLRQLLDPAGRHYATGHMIVIAHSMGGLLGRTLVTDSGDDLWNSTFAIPISDLDPNLEQLPELRRVFYFRPNPCIKRIIFLAVPHRGSKTADSLMGRLVSGWVTLPDTLHQFIAGLKKSVPGMLKPESAALFKNGYPSSIRVLSPTTPGLVALAKLPVDPATPFHSIMGDRGRGGGENSSDGVVPYSSARLAGASSERIVASNHRVPEHPAAIAEVKRILKRHVADLELRERSAAPEPADDAPED